jgi:hypothetical protein
METILLEASFGSKTENIIPPTPEVLSSPKSVPETRLGGSYMHMPARWYSHPIPLYLAAIRQQSEIKYI